MPRTPSDIIPAEAAEPKALIHRLIVRRTPSDVMRTPFDVIPAEAGIHSAAAGRALPVDRPASG